VHEIKPVAPDESASAAAGVAAAFGFVLMLAVRRLQSLPKRSDAPEPRILWCWPSALADETGHLYAPGLLGLGLDPSTLLVVETAREKDALWAIEEGLSSGSLTLVAGALRGMELTPARRLALAAKAGATPALIMTAGRGPGAAATATRWRVAPSQSAAHPLEDHAPGAARLSLSLERCRNRPGGGAIGAFSLEWCDAAHCFRVACRPGDRADGTHRSRRHAR
jgi:protein ImuA